MPYIIGEVLLGMNTDEEKVEWREATTFDLTNTPTSAGAVHEYTIDGGAIAEGEKGVTMKIDSDGDGSFERLFIENPTGYPPACWREESGSP